ncbi:hypothetical protein BJX66DRAFT_324678 [Aspergillus keveii]|uniref:Glyoxalase-like domain-containing protein n=1 Tax=Aspergillus keveii TaxID=714993 RepID=A0ABR4G8Q9_9EURO
MPSQQVYIDHLLLQFSQEQFETLPRWILDNFTVIDGGVHTGGLSRNKLIIFRDGTYLELYNWITKPEDWRERLPGDFALTTLNPITAEASQERIANALASDPGDGGVGVTYSRPRKAAAKTPKGSMCAGRLLSQGIPRRTRRPGTNSIREGAQMRRFSAMISLRHPSGATGIERIDVVVPRGGLSRYSDVYASIVGAAPEERDGAIEFRLSAPGVHSFYGSLRVQEAKTAEDEQFLRQKGIGISSLALRSETGQPISFSIAEFLQ